MKIGILCYQGHELEKMKDSVKKSGADYKVIDLMSNDWLDSCEENIDGYIVRPPCNYQEHKTIFDERVYFINEVLKKPIYPSLNEIYTYENKRNMCLFLKYFDIPHPKTRIYSSKNEALSNLDDIKFPVVSKSNIGAGGSAVSIIKDAKQYKKYIDRVFGRFSPELALGLVPWISTKGIKVPRFGRAQKHYAIIQDFLNIKWEWRMIRIGDSYFGHQKLLGENGYASGSELVGWNRPTDELLHLLKDSTDKMQMRCMVLDVFETTEGEYFVNEMQSIIGAYRPYQMKVDGKPGRFKFEDNQFVFEEGIHCDNSCWDPRVNDFIKMLHEGV
ncbi:hypothetical protein ACTIQ8_002551 [Vibrio parahaemolyticus]